MARHHRREAEPENRRGSILEDYYAPSNIEWLLKRDLDMQVTPPFSTTRATSS